MMMRTRVGITTDESESKQHWKRQESTLKNWKIVERGLTKEKAQAKEDELKRRLGYKGASEGPDVPGKSWSVYTFKFWDYNGE